MRTGDGGNGDGVIVTSRCILMEEGKEVERAMVLEKERCGSILY